MRRATWKIIALPFVRMPIGMALLMCVWVVLTALVPFAGAPLLFGVAMVLWLAGMLLGLTLRSLVRPETLLLPRFRARLAAAGAVYALVGIGLPVMLALLAGRGVPLLALAAAGMLFAVVLGLSAGAGVRASLFAWIVFPLTGILPRPLQATLAEVALHSVWVPVLAVLLSALLLDYTLRPMLLARDGEDAESPLQAIADGRKTTSTSASGMPRRRGFIGNKLARVLDASAHYAFARALRRFLRRPGAATRMRLIRAVLLPHDNALGIAINLAAIMVLVVAYMLLIPDVRHWGVGGVAAYALVLGMSRFAAIGQGMLKMQPNLADLYMTLGPATNREFQAVLANALLWVVVVAVINMLAFTLLIAIMLHAPAPGELLLATLIVGIGAAFGGLAAHLIGPTSRGGRIGVQFVLILVAVGMYELVLWLMHRFGLPVGALAGLVICLPFGLGAWHTARRIYLQRRPCFDAPLD